MKEIRVNFTERIIRTETVHSLRFVSEEKIVFAPGQFLQLILDEHDKNNNSLNKYLSFSCAPGKNYIEITKRLTSSEFSKKLSNLKKGDPALIKAPMGNCVYKDEYTKIGFLIGGIGITPVISIIEHIIDNKFDTNVCLLYSNRIEQDIPFMKELNNWQTKHSNQIKVIYILSDCEPADNRCLKGHINKDFITEHMPDWQQRVIYVYGPPDMVNAMNEACISMPCNRANLRMESFLGY